MTVHILYMKPYMPWLLGLSETIRMCKVKIKNMLSISSHSFIATVLIVLRPKGVFGK